MACSCFVAEPWTCSCQWSVDEIHSQDGPSCSLRPSCTSASLASRSSSWTAFAHGFQLARLWRSTALPSASGCLELARRSRWSLKSRHWWSSKHYLNSLHSLFHLHALLFAEMATFPTRPHACRTAGVALRHISTCWRYGSVRAACELSDVRKLFHYRYTNFKLCPGFSQLLHADDKAYSTKD